MPHCLKVVIVVVSALSSCAHVQAVDLSDSKLDKIALPVEDSTQTQAACSCDCCQVQKLQAVDFQTMQDGKTITSACSKSVGGTAIEESARNDESNICPALCQIPTSNQIIFSNKGEVDYNRFCGYNCQPLSDAPGSSCVQLSRKDYETAQTRDGNGNDLLLPPVFGIGSGYEPQESSDNGVAFAGRVSGASATPRESMGTGAAGSSTAIVGQGATNPKDPVEIVYDTKKLIAARLRSEAGAAIAQAASSAEQVRINNFKAAQDATELEKLHAEVGASAAKVEAGVTSVEGQKNYAAEAARKAQQASLSGKSLAEQVVKDTQKLTDEAIKKEVTRYAEVVAERQAEASGLDKPEAWSKVIAARAALPYQAALSTAVQRSDEYKHLADTLVDKASVSQQEANSLISEVNAMDAQGDPLGANIARTQAKNFLSSAKAFAADAGVAQGIAERAHNSIPEWQNAAAQASTYARWEYSTNSRQ